MSKPERYKLIRQQKREYVWAAKDKPCSDCGLHFPYYVMDFDHVRGEKLFNIGYYQTKSLKMIREEIEKCDVVCSNCHRIREHERLEQTLPATL